MEDSESLFLRRIGLSPGAIDELESAAAVRGETVFQLLRWLLETYHKLGRQRDAELRRPLRAAGGRLN